jgi:hypothetical protein
MRGGRLTSRQLVALILGIGLLLEIPLVLWIVTLDDDQPAAVGTTQPSVRGVRSTQPLHPVAGRFKPDDTQLPDCSDQACFEQAYGNIAFRQGPKAAFSYLEQQFPGGSDPNCHRIVHIIGAVALARNNDNVA